MIRLAPALLTAVALLSLSGAARAQGPDGSSQAPTAAPAPPRSADALFNEGIALLKAGKLEEACGKLAESQSIEPAIGTLGLLAYCHEQSGKLATAMREYGEVAELAHLAAQNGREKVARERVEQLASHVTRLAIALSEPADQVEVYLDARRLGASELGASTPVDAGTFQLRVTGNDVEPWTQSLSIPADGSTLRVVVPRLTRKAAPVAVAPKAPPSAPPEPDRGMRRPAVWASFGASALGLAVGSYFGLSAIAARSDARPHCNGNQCDQAGVDARDLALGRARVSTIAFSVAAIGAATGSILILTDHHDQPRQQAALRVVPGGAALSWERRF